MDRSSSELSLSLSLASESGISRNTAASTSPDPRSQPGVVSSEETSATPETVPSFASPTVLGGPIEILQFQIAIAKAKEDELRVTLEGSYQEETYFFQRAQNARQEAKEKILQVKNIRAEMNGLKTRAQDFEKKAKALKSLRPNLVEEVEEAEHERTNLEKKLEDLKYEEKLVRRYPDPVIRMLVKKIQRDYNLNGILENFMVGEGRLQDVEALQAELDSICEDSKEKGEILSAERSTPDDKSIKNEDLEYIIDDHSPPAAYETSFGPALDAGHEAGETIASNEIFVILECGKEVDVDKEVVSIKQEPGGKSGLGVKNEPDLKDDGISGNQTEMGLRTDLRSLKAALQSMQARSRWLIGGKRKRDDGED